MKIIGIWGGSGTGKSTVTKLLNSKLEKSFIIYGDDFMLRAYDEKKEIILEKLNITEKVKYVWHCANENIEVRKLVIDIIEESVYEGVLNVINENKNLYDYILVDWHSIPISRLQNICNSTICVFADYETTLARLTNRLKNESLNELDDKVYENGAIEKRVKMTALNNFGCNADFYIENNHGLEELELQVEKVKKKLKLGEI